MHFVSFVVGFLVGVVLTGVYCYGVIHIMGEEFDEVLERSAPPLTGK